MGFIMSNYKRRDKINYYLDFAETVLKRGTCLYYNSGAVIVKNNEIIAAGYNGAPRCRANCIDLGYCTWDKLSSEKKERCELCRGVHAEVNAVLTASRKDMTGATLYLAERDVKTHSLCKEKEPCGICRRIIINAGISTVIIRNTPDVYTVINVESWIEKDDSLIT